MNTTNKPTELSLTFINDDMLKQYVYNCINYHIQQLVSFNNSWYGPTQDKTMFYFTGVAPYREVYIRKWIDELRPRVTGFAIRITKRAGFDAMLTITITRKRSNKMIFFT